MMEDLYKDIRPYYDSELQEAFAKLMSDDNFLSVAKSLFPESTYANLGEILKQIPTTQALQEQLIFPIITNILRKEGTVLTSSGLQKEGMEPALFVSNHRDIVTDPAFLDYIFLADHIQTVQIAIGDNLLAAPWIETLVKINRSFIVQRKYTAQEAAKIFQNLSGYIRHTITEEKQSIWIAQREGRAKDSNDRTQESILKMFALSGNSSFVDNLKDLNIRPTSISYEFDPCDYLKAIELQNRRDDVNFVKCKNDDLLSMQTGIFGKKGRVHYAFAPSINEQLDKIGEQTKNRKEQVALVKDLIDQTIFQNYVLYPINYVAYEALTGNTTFVEKVTPEERIAAEDYIEKQLQRIDGVMDHPDKPYLRSVFLAMYANPLMNKQHLRE